MSTTPNRDPAQTTPPPSAPLPSQPSSARSAADTPVLAPPGSEERWWQLQGLRRGRVDPGPFLAGLERGELPAHQDLLEALLGVLNRAGVERLLANPRALAGPTLLEAGRRELPLLAGQERVRQAWLTPLLAHHQQMARQDPANADRWLELLGPFRDPEVAARLRQSLLRHRGSSGQRPEAEALAPGSSAVRNPGAAIDAAASAGAAAGAGAAATQPAATPNAMGSSYAMAAAEAMAAADRADAKDPAEATAAMDLIDGRAALAATDRADALAAMGSPNAMAAAEAMAAADRADAKDPAEATAAMDLIDGRAALVATDRADALTSAAATQATAGLAATDPADPWHDVNVPWVAPTATAPTVLSPPAFQPRALEPTVLEPTALEPTVAGAALGTSAGVEALAPLLGLQRQPQDGAVLLELAMAPGPLAQRRAALEGLALGLSVWPQEPLSAGLVRLSGDLDPQLAACAVDLLARLPEGSRALRRVARQSLDPTVRARLRRRLPSSPLVLLVHGRQGGQIPPELQALAAELGQWRGGPVLLQTLTANEEPQPEAAFWTAAQRAGGLTLVPLLLLPGGHVRHDLPALARAWRQRASAAGGLALWRCPFLGSWPSWQRQLRRHLIALAADQPLLWLHHPLEGPLGARYLAHLSQLLGNPGQAAPLEAGMPRPAELQGPGLLVPWSLAANRMSDALAASDQLPGQRLLPPFLQVPDLRHTLLQLLSALA
jgi:hypothetical protein